MAYNIKIGYTKKPFKDGSMHTSRFVEYCQGEEPDGITSEVYACRTHRTPTRNPSNAGWDEFANIWLNGKLNPQCHDGVTYRIDHYLDKLKWLQERSSWNDSTMSPIDRDRAKWLCYWALKAHELYGPRAAMIFT